jgi:hypothetical protein
MGLINLNQLISFPRKTFKNMKPATAILPGKLLEKWINWGD